MRSVLFPQTKKWGVFDHPTVGLYETEDAYEIEVLKANPEVLVMGGEDDGEETTLEFQEVPVEGVSGVKETIPVVKRKPGRPRRA